ncbi:MAG: hypothetical protein MI974_20830 [Chitinophagales bacterium]|nr:hypothetical protein [Chitinophagales bacterium]
MSVISDIRSIGWVVDKLVGYLGENKVRTNEALTAIHAAWTRTYDYLKNQNGEYVPNQDLSDMWNDAASKTRLVGFHLAEQLTDKSRFWIHPDLPRQNRIISLVELTDEMERLEMKFKK